MGSEKQKISDLNINDEKKAILSFMAQPRTIPQVAAKFDISYSHTYQLLVIWSEKKWLTRHESLSGKKTIYKLNQSLLEL